MIHRENSDTLVVFTQPTHAWVSGQLARYWGNQRFGEVTPYEEVCLGAALHDIGWLEWENAPTLNPKTGLPHNYTQMPRHLHLEIWSSASRLALPYGRYAALLVSLHGTGLYEGLDDSLEAPEQAEAIRTYLATEQQFQTDLIASLRQDSYYTNDVTPEILRRNRWLLSIWDSLSLVICRGVKTSYTLSNVPTAAGETKLMLSPLESDSNRIQVEPWPFQQKVLTISVEGRHLAKQSSTQDEMQTALAQAASQTMTFHFTQAL
ncbi:MAG: DUF3891 family protein [Chloroflexota bacterium]